MTYVPQNLQTPEIELQSGSYLDWGAIFAGIILASAISVVLLAFGSAIGLSFSAATVSAKSYAIGAGIGAALWFIWVQVSSFMAGAYLTGRMRKRKHDSTDHEVEVRDGSHGLVVWAGAVVLGSYLALSGASSLVSSAGSIVKIATAPASLAAGGASTGLMDYYQDLLLRQDTTIVTSPARVDKAAVSREIGTILANSAMAPSSPDEKAYVAQLVGQQTGLAPDAAKARVEDVYAKIDAAKTEAARTAEVARRVGIVAAFLLAASLLVSAAAAYWAAASGGRHRDDSAVFTGFFRRL